MWVASGGGGQKGTGRHLAQRGFSISFTWAASRRRMSLARCIMGVSVTEDQTPQGLA